MGLEFVRAIVPPSFRPPARITPAIERAEDDGVTVIAGRSGSIIDMQHSRRWSTQHPRETETSRTYDVVRIKNENDPEQYVDAEVVHRLRVRGADGSNRRLRLTKPEATSTVEILQQNLVRNTQE